MMSRKIFTQVAAVLLCLMSGAAFAQKWNTAAPIPQGAEEVYGIPANGKLYVFGGLALAWKPIGMVMEYDPAKNAWTRKKDMPAYHHHFALAEMNGKIYMFGGYQLPPAGQPTWVPVDNAWEYDPQADSWKALAPVPQARGSINALAVNGKIHLIGGATLPAGTKGDYIHPSRNVSVATHELYDPASNSYSKRAELPTARNHAAGGVIDGKIYIAGGRTGSVFIPNAFNVDLVDEYDPATDQWSLKTPMPTPRSATAWGVYNGRLFVAGGEVRHRDYWATYTTVEAFDAKSNTWSRLPPMPMPRHGLAGGFLGSNFHLVSGSLQSGTNVPGLVTGTDRHDVLSFDAK